MPELQTFLQKKKDQNTAQEDQCRRQKARRKRTAMFGMAAAGVIPLLAPPLGTDPSVFALASVAESISGLSDDEEQSVYNALLAAMIAENEEARKTGDLPTENKTYEEAARNALQEWKQKAESILEEMDELHLLELEGEDTWVKEDGTTQKKIQQVPDDGSRIFDENGKDLDKTAKDGLALDRTTSVQTGTPAQAAVGERAVKASPATGETGTKATAAAGEIGTKGTKASIAIGGAGIRVAAAGEGVSIQFPISKTEEDKEKETAAEVKAQVKIEEKIPSVLALQYNARYVALKLSDEQLAVLERIVEAEAGDEDAYGKILVANVVLNRVLNEEFPDTVKEVVFQNNGKTYQFSPVRKGGRYYTVKVSKHTKEAVARALKGEDYSNGALYFFARRYTSEKKANWFDTSLKKIVEYGCHEFFGDK